MQHEFKNDVKRYDRGVKQAGFLVLYKTTMPAILVELGFVSNVNEEKYLRSATGRTDLAQGIFRAFEKYKVSVEQVNSAITEEGGQAPKDPEVEEPKDNVDPNKEVYKVQFEMSSEKKDLKPENFNGLNDIDVYKSGGFYKYTSGEFDTFEEANKHKHRVRDAGYESAFVVKFKGGERVK